MDMEAIMARLVQIGRVSAVDTGKKMVRVIFTKSGMTIGRFRPPLTARPPRRLLSRWTP